MGKINDFYAFYEKYKLDKVLKQIEEKLSQEHNFLLGLFTIDQEVLDGLKLYAIDQYLEQSLIDYT